MSKEITLSTEFSTEFKNEGYLKVSVLYDAEENTFTDVKVYSNKENAKSIDITSSLESLVGVNNLYNKVADIDWRMIYRSSL